MAAVAASPFTLLFELFAIFLERFLQNEFIRRHGLQNAEVAKHGVQHLHNLQQVIGSSDSLSPLSDLLKETRGSKKVLGRPCI